METRLFILLFVASLFVFDRLTANAEVTIPSVPSEWVATIEANINNKNYTITMKEWHDEPNDRGRVDIWSYREHGFTSSIYDFASQRYYHTNISGCYWGSTERISDFNFIASHQGGATHLTTSERLMALASNATHAYVGEAEVRGIDVDTWSSDIVCAHRNTSYTDPCDLNYTLFWSFSSKTSQWNWPENPDAARVPVRIELRGSKLSRYDRATHAPLNPPYHHEIWHVYDYHSVHVGPPDDVDFEIPCGVTCASEDPEWDASEIPAVACCSASNGNVAEESQGWSDSNVAGLSFGMVLVGAVLGSAVVVFFGRLAMPSSVGRAPPSASVGAL